MELKYTSEREIMLIQNDNFNLLQIAASGQCFRMNQIKGDKFELIAYDKYIEIEQIGEYQVTLSCSEEDYHQLWKSYFDLEYDYHSIVESLLQGEDDFLKRAAAYGRGIRILRQEPFEMMISFIISQNKNIPSIKCCIERICESYGEEIVCGDGRGSKKYAFPKPEALAAARSEDLRKLKLGYRDEYIIRASQAVAEGKLDLQELMRCSHEEAVTALKQIHGIGEKVANCISLYGLHHIEAFPIDVWIRRILEEVYHNQFQLERYQGYAGIVQQYMFYYMRQHFHHKAADVQ